MKKFADIKIEKFSQQELLNIKTNNISKKDIAIVGIAGRFANADTIEEFWKYISEGKDLIKDLPKSRLVAEDGTHVTKKHNFIEGAYLNEIDNFDYSLFSISPSEANMMDPNQRIFLQTAYQAIEDAGYAGKIEGTKTGVYVGFSSDFAEEYRRLVQKSNPEMLNLSVTGNIKSIIASRVAYILDLKGPSMMIDTACSSSLVAVHLACQGIRNGDCNMALAGGIKINIVPMEKNSEANLGIESSDGRSKTFDDDSDGTGHGEGVGVVMLKPLSRAIADGDSIYAVIKGSAINQDGSSIGITAPNCAAQEDVILNAWKSANVDPESISYIEAHGTATKLGDPIEISGIERAFRNYTDKKQFCAIGSVKTNLGHLDCSAGIASLMKVIMMLKYKQLAPSIHFRKPNRKIDFVESPVYVNDVLREWESNGTPLRCGINSFGLSGTNCHMILEEALSEDVETENTNSKRLHVLAISAKNEEVLKQLVKKYERYIDNSINIADMCYTANTGRNHFNCRIALIFKSIEELKQKINQISIAGFELGNGIYYGNFKKNNGQPTENKIREISENAAKIISQINLNESGLSELEKLCTLYVSGADINWNGLYEGEKRKRLHIPTYPFMKKRCWFDNMPKLLNDIPTEGKFEHPLIGECLVSNPECDIYSSYLSTEKYWVLNEHVIEGKSVVPGTTYIEMIRAVCNKYYNNNMEFKNVVFISPLIVESNKPKEVQIIIKKLGEQIEFSIISQNPHQNDWIKHVDGRVCYAEKTEHLHIDIEAIKQRCKLEQIINFDEIPDDVIGAGPRWRCLKHLFVGEEELLADLRLADKYSKDLAEYYIHPSLFDCAVNSANGSVVDSFHLPLSYKRLKIYGSTPQSFYSHLRKKKREKENSETASFDITLFDENGRVFIEIEDYSIKRVHNKLDTANSEVDKVLHQINWIICNDAPKENSNISQKTILVLKDDEGIANKVINNLKEKNDVVEIEFGEKYSNNDNKFVITGTQDEYERILIKLMGKQVTNILHFSSISASEPQNIAQLERSQIKGLYSLYYLTKCLVNNKFREKICISIVTKNVNAITGNEHYINHLSAPLIGLGKVITQEYSNLVVRCIDYDESITTKSIIEELSYNEGLYSIAYRNGKRYKEQLAKVNLDQVEQANFSIKEDGVYLITGGTGGLGLAIARSLAMKKKVTLALVSRSGLPDSILMDDILLKNTDIKLCNKIKSIKEIEALGSRVLIYKADVSNESEISNVINDIKQNYGTINGIIHAAGLPGDGFIMRKQDDIFKQVIAPKVQGTYLLDRLTREFNTDFFIMFSSITTLFGAAGQGDYTAANSYLDCYAEYMRKSGRKACTINWSLWNDTGMAVDFELANQRGMFKTLSKEEAINLFDEVVNLNLSRVIVGKLDYEVMADFYETIPMELSESITSSIHKLSKLPNTHNSAKTVEINCTDITIRGYGAEEPDEIDTKVAQAWARVLGLDEIGIYDNFNDLGGDSILATHLLKQLEKEYPGIIDITDIFTYSTIYDMAKYIKGKLNIPENKSEEKKKKVETSEEDLDEILLKLASGQIDVDEAGELLI